MSFIRPPILMLMLLLASVLPLHAQYYGGDGSGSALAQETQASCTAIVYPVIYSGGNENLSLSAGLTQVSCSTPAMPSIFGGGNESLTNSSAIVQSACSPVVYPSVYAGGNESLNTSVSLNQSSCSPNVYPAIYTGGTEDGYSFQNLAQTACNPTSYPGIYAGGIGNIEGSYQLNVACAPYADFKGDTLFVCAGDTVHFTDLSLGSPTSWNWTFAGGNPLASATQNPEIVYNTPGTYQVSLSISSPNGNGSITKTNYINVGTLPVPIIVAGGATTFCEGDSVKLSATNTFSAYEWSNGQNTQSIYAINSGNYTLTVTGANGCKASSGAIPVTVNSNPIPLITANGPTTLCDADTLVLTATPAAGYTWLPGGETSQTVDVTTNGTYYVKVSYGNGCQRTSAPVSATFGTTPATPVISANGPLTFCEGDSVILTTSPADSYFWSPASGISQSVTIKNNGSYFVTVGNGTGCTATSLPVIVNVHSQTIASAVTASGPISFCQGDSVTLTASPAANYHWLPGGEITQSITVHNSGSYSVQTDNGNNCPAYSPATNVIVHAIPAIPLVSISGPTTFCAGNSVVLTSSLADSYLWSPGGQTTQSITVTDPGNYSVSAGNSNGCLNASVNIPVTVTAQTPVPTITASGSTTFCSGDSVTLTASPATSYHWIPGGQSTQSITVHNSGSYSVQTDNGNNCPAISATSVVVSNTTPAVPLVSILGSTTFCAGDSVVLTSGLADSYLWSPGGQTTQSITVTNPGNYSVSTGNSNGCQSTSINIPVTVNAQTPVPTITASGSTTFCSGDSVTLTASPAASYHWIPGGQTSQSITVFNSGIYSVQTGIGLCPALSAPLAVTVNSQPTIPVVIASGPTAFCSGDSVILTASPAGSYLWFPGGQTSQTITVYNSGSYSVQVDNGTSCTAISSASNVSVQSLPATPVITAGSALSFCNGDSVILTSSPAANYHWYPGGQNTQSIIVYSSGTWYVETGSGSCISVSAPLNSSVLSAPAVPTVTVNGNSNLCQGDSVLLSATPADHYLWSPGGQNTQGIWVSQSGTYYVSVSNSNGCGTQSNNGTTISVNPLPSVLLTGTAVACHNTSESFTLTNVPNQNYFWTVDGAILTSGSGTNSINVFFGDTGQVNISVIVTNTATSCSNSDTLPVSVLEAPVAFAGPDRILCEGDTIQLQASGGTTCQWTPAIFLSSDIVANPYCSPPTSMTYILSVANGSCTDADTININVNQRPIANAGNDHYIYSDSCAILDASGGQNYLWSPVYGLSSTTLPNPDACPDSTTTYYVLVSNSAGCQASDSVTVYVTLREGGLTFPNTFTPNSDGKNDTWEIDGLNLYPKHSLVVYNRWGNKVFDAAPYQNDWEGDCIGKPLPDGTYFFVFDPGNNDPLIRGYVTILR